MSAYDELNGKSTEELLRYRFDQIHSPWIPMVELLLQTRLMGETAGAVKVLTAETTKVHREVALLTASSDKLELLTKRLNGLTWALIILTGLAVAEPIAIEIWKAHREPQTAPVSAHPEPWR
jgi:hypothetical protein